MSELRDDEVIRERFRRLREEDAVRAPDARAMIARARAEAGGVPRLEVTPGGVPPAEGPRRPARWSLRGWAGWASAGLAAALAGLLLYSPGDPADREFERLVTSFTNERSGGAWRSPTDGLLAVPGIEYIRSVPSVGLPLRGLPGGEEAGATGSGERESRS